MNECAVAHYEDQRKSPPLTAADPSITVSTLSRSAALSFTAHPPNRDVVALQGELLALQEEAARRGHSIVSAEIPHGGRGGMFFEPQVSLSNLLHMGQSQHQPHAMILQALEQQQRREQQQITVEQGSSLPPQAPTKFTPPAGSTLVVVGDSRHTGNGVPSSTYLMTPQGSDAFGVPPRMIDLQGTAPFSGEDGRRMTVSTDSGPTKACALYMDCDVDNLSEYQCMVRKNIEIFEASASDLDSTAKGRNKPILLGQVGIRCRHCAWLDPRDKRKGAMFYPAKLSGIYQAAQSLASTHLCHHCEHVPPDTRKLLLTLKEWKSSAGGGKDYWSDSARVIGVCEDPERGLFYKTRGI